MNVVVSSTDDAVLGDWSSFGDCDNTCGDGTHTRARECIINEEGCIPTDTSGDCEVALSESRCCVGFSECGASSHTFLCFKILLFHVFNFLTVMLWNAPAISKAVLAVRSHQCIQTHVTNLLQIQCKYFLIRSGLDVS